MSAKFRRIKKLKLFLLTPDRALIVLMHGGSTESDIESILINQQV